MTITISRLYDTYAAATEAVRNLEIAGVPHRDISIVSNNADNWYSDNHATGAGAGAGVGATAGGLAGLLTGLGLLAIPGVGPVVAAGWLVATAAGAAVGGTAGGIIGALTQAGTSDEEARLYAEGVRRGGTLVSARVADADRSKYEAVLDRSSVNVQDRGAAWRKTGWTTFDPQATPYTADQVRKEREIYRSGGSR
jgi:hypothetical protein